MPKKNTTQSFQHHELPHVATATLMYATSYPKELNNAMRHVSSLFGDSMSGWTMEKIRWQHSLMCYGFNSMTSSTNMRSPPICVIVGTVGPTALDAAKQDVQACFDEHCGAITQEQLDTAHERIKGEVAVRTDYTSDIHALVHGHLVGGEKPTIVVEKPSLEDSAPSNGRALAMALPTSARHS